MQYTEILEGADSWFVARLLLPDQTNLSQAAILASTLDAIRVRVYDISSETTDPDSVGGGLHYSQDVDSTSPGTALNAIILLPTSGNSLQTDGYWNGTDEGGRRYKVEFHIKTTDFGTISWTAGLYTRSMLLE